jgi:hypothetical protein
MSGKSGTTKAKAVHDFSLTIADKEFGGHDRGRARTIDNRLISRPSKQRLSIVQP